MENQKQLCIQSIKEQFEKYKENDHMLDRIDYYLLKYLPNQLSQEESSHKSKQIKNEMLIKEQNTFIQVFLQTNLFYYLPSNGTFFEYIRNDYRIIKEDDIIHKLLSMITKEKILVEWKEKTKTNILKKIKERVLFDCTPESDTIQTVIKYLYPSIFETKNYAKYFLTVIGDVLLKKSTVTYLVSPQIKKMIIDIEDISNACIGINNINSQFITKHHENNPYENYRLIKINKNYSNSLWKDSLKIIGLNLLCVACHYSKRHKSSECFLDTKLDDYLKQYTLFLKITKETEIISEFCDKFIITSETLQLSWKDCHFLWKEYLQENSLYNIIYSTTLKQLLKNKFEFNEENDLFIGITSKFLPKQKDFLTFWEESMKQNTVTDFEDEVEIDEICTFYKNWSRSNKENKYITEEKVINILKHFHSELMILDDKYIVNISFISWNKIKDINELLVNFINSCLTNYELALISFDDIYIFYEKGCSQQNKQVVSKRYFEKYLCYKFGDTIVYDKFIPLEKLVISSC